MESSDLEQNEGKDGDPSVPEGPAPDDIHPVIEVEEVDAEPPEEPKAEEEEDPRVLLEKLRMDEEEFTSYIKPVYPQKTVQQGMGVGVSGVQKPSPEQDMLHDLIAKGGTSIFLQIDDPISEQALIILKSLNLKLHVIRLDLIEGGDTVKKLLFDYCGINSLPIAFVNGQLIGGYEDIWYLYYTQLFSLVLDRGNPSFKENFSFTYDLIVIGGGPAGISAALEAAKLGKRVAIVNYVTPTAHGRTWGIGGSYINAGSISKNLLYTASGFVHSFSPENRKQSTPNWKKLVSDICEHIKSITFSLRSKIKEVGCEYINARAKFITDHSIQVKYPKRSGTAQLTSSVYVIATGSRPRYPKYIKGALENCLTTDDFFWSPVAPGKTLVITTSHIGLECATILATFNFPVTVLLLPPAGQDIDYEILKRAKSHMETLNIKFLQDLHIESVEAISPDEDQHKMKVRGLSTKGVQYEENFDTILLECGRYPNTAHLGLCKVGIKVNNRSRKVIVDDENRTNIKHIFALGDIVHDWPEIGTVAKKSGITLIQRLYKGMLKYVDLSYVPERILFPVEYGKIGLTEQAAIDLFGSKVKSYEADSHVLGTLHEASSLRAYFYLKIICLQRDKGEEVIAIHLLSHKAAEMLQGLSISLQKGVTKDDFREMIPLHPIFSEAVSNMKIRYTSFDVAKAIREEEMEKTVMKAIEDVAPFKKRKREKVRKKISDVSRIKQRDEDSYQEAEIRRNKGPRISKSMERFIIEVIIKGRDDYVETEEEGQGDSISKDAEEEETSSESGSEESGSEENGSEESSDSISGESESLSNEGETEEEDEGEHDEAEEADEEEAGSKSSNNIVDEIGEEEISSSLDGEGE